MQIKEIIVIAVVIAIISIAVSSIIVMKRRGVKCIGCSKSCDCGSNTKSKEGNCNSHNQ